MTRPPALGDHLGHLVHLSLRTAEGAEPLLSELAGALVLAVAEEFDNAALVWCEAEKCVLVSSSFLHGNIGMPYPETSFTISLTNAVLLLRCPFMRETRGFGWRGVTFCCSILR